MKLGRSHLRGDLSAHPSSRCHKQLCGQQDRRRVGSKQTGRLNNKMWHQNRVFFCSSFWVVGERRSTASTLASYERISHFSLNSLPTSESGKRQCIPTRVQKSREGRPRSCKADFTFHSHSPVLLSRMSGGRGGRVEKPPWPLKSPRTEQQSHGAKANARTTLLPPASPLPELRPLLTP